MAWPRRQESATHDIHLTSAVIITNPWWLCWGSCSTLPIALGAYVPELGEEALARLAGDVAAAPGPNVILSPDCPGRRVAFYD